MRPTFSGFNTMIRGLYANQISLDTVGHNITNGNTPGYSRQIVSRVTGRSEDIFSTSGVPLQMGTGAVVNGIERVRDPFIDQQLWREYSKLGNVATTDDMLSRIEGVFTEPSDTGIQSVLDGFWNSIQTMGTNPADVGGRTAVRQKGVQLVDILKYSGKQLEEMAVDINNTISKNVDKINRLSATILDLNKKILDVELTPSTSANDLRDSRDNAVDELMTLTKAYCYEDQKGNYVVQMDGVVLVSGLSSVKLRTVKDPDAQINKDFGLGALAVETSDIPPTRVTFSGGEMAALFSARDSEAGVHGYRKMVDDMAKTLLCDFNQIHKEGLGLDNVGGVNFFGKSGVQYADLLGAGGPAGNSGLTTNWLSALKVNDLLFDPISGLDKIASKTLAGSVDVLLSTMDPTKIVIGKTNPATGDAKIVDPLGFMYKGNVATNFKFKVTEMDPSGKPTKVQYQMDTGSGFPDPTIPANWKNAEVDNTSGHAIIRFKGDVPFSYDLKASLDTNPANMTAGAEWNFTVQPSKGGAAEIVNKANVIYDSKLSTNFELNVESVDANGYITGLKYTMDGGTTWKTLAAGDIVIDPVSGKTKVKIAGNAPFNYDIDLEIAANEGNIKDNKYRFSLPQGNGAGDNAVRMAQYLKYGAKDPSVTKLSKYMGHGNYQAALSDKSIDSYYASGVGTLGIQKETSASTLESVQSIVEQMSSWRQSVSGVNLDEELTNMILFQKGYNSAARVLTTMDEMLDKLINGTGVVGR